MCVVRAEESWSPDPDAAPITKGTAGVAATRERASAALPAPKLCAYFWLAPIPEGLGDVSSCLFQALLDLVRTELPRAVQMSQIRDYERCLDSSQMVKDGKPNVLHALHEGAHYPLISLVANACHHSLEALLGHFRPHVQRLVAQHLFSSIGSEKPSKIRPEQVVRSG